MGRGVYLQPLQNWSRCLLTSQPKKLIASLPNRPLNEMDLLHFGQYLPHFRGVFMRDNLPNSPNYNECAIMNLQTMSENGSHW